MDRTPPPWPEQVVAALVDGCEPAAAAVWADRLRGELARLGATLPWSVVHDWHAGTVAPLLGEACEGYAVVGALHARALAGTPVPVAEWAAALEPALREVYRRAYDYGVAYRANYDNAHAYGTANGFGEEGTREYATYYADLATGANHKAYAHANAIANAHALAAALAAADPVAYAATHPYAATRAYALAAGGDGEPARQHAAHARLADGFLSSLARCTHDTQG